MTRRPGGPATSTCTSAVAFGRTIIGGTTILAVRIVGGIPVPKRVVHVDPVYPSIALAARIGATVVVALVVSDSGFILDARIMRSIPLLDAPILDAVRRWKYERLLIDGRPTAFVVPVAITYAPDSRAAARGFGIVIDPSPEC